MSAAIPTWRRARVVHHLFAIVGPRVGPFPAGGFTWSLQHLDLRSCDGKVLVACDGNRRGAFAGRNPCLAGRGGTEASDGWHARLTFLVPPSAEDPKALG